MKKANEIKLPPNDNDAEEAVIGSLLIDGDSIEHVVNFLKPDDFYYEQSRLIYSACINLYNRKEGINNVTVGQELTRLDQLEMVGGAARLSYLISVPATSMDIEHFANIVQRLSTMRRLINAGQQISAIGYDSEPDVAKCIEKVDIIVKAIKKNYGKVEILHPRERGELAFSRYHKLETMEAVPTLPTGFYKLDKVMGGGQMGGELLVLCGASGLGKSTLAQRIAINQSEHGDVLICTGEMTWGALTDKEIATEVGCTVLDIRAGHYNTELADKIYNGTGIISERPIHILGAPLSMSKIRQAAYYMKTNYDLKSIWIDYLGKIELMGGREENTYAKIGHVVEDLKNMAMELDVPVNVLAQISREVGNRPDKRPVLSDIYESGKIEHEADWILFFYRADKYFNEESWRKYYFTEQAKEGSLGYNEHLPAGIAEIILDKTRFSENIRQVCQIVWNHQRQTYDNLQRED